MLKHYIKFALRNFRSNKIIFGGSLLTLCLGALCISLLFSYVHNELSMDDFHKHKEDVYMVTKEIAIRKVNGARISEILILLNKSFIKWVGLAFIIACPIAYLAMSKWLENFAYKTELSWWIFAMAGLSTLLMALLTVSWQSYTAATANPAEALRSE